MFDELTFDEDELTFDEDELTFDDAELDGSFFEELEEVEAVVDGLLVEVAEKRLDIVVSRVLFSGWCNSLVLSVPKSSAQKSFFEDVFFEDESLEVLFEAVFLLAVVLEV